MPHRNSVLPGVALAASLAGPIFCFSYAAADLHLSLPRAVPVRPADIAQFALILLPAGLVGFVLGFIPNLLGATGMRALASGWPPARLPAAWAAAGAAAGTGIGQLTGAPGGIFFALVATSVLCALICRYRLDLSSSS